MYDLKKTYQSNANCMLPLLWGCLLLSFTFREAYLFKLTIVHIYMLCVVMHQINLNTIAPFQCDDICTLGVGMVTPSRSSFCACCNKYLFFFNSAPFLFPLAWKHKWGLSENALIWKLLFLSILSKVPGPQEILLHTFLEKAQKSCPPLFSLLLIQWLLDLLTPRTLDLLRHNI